MWISGAVWDMSQAERLVLRDEHVRIVSELSKAAERATVLREQKAKDDVTIDWLRNRVNALEKEKSALLAKEGIHLPVPEIQQSVPRTLEASFDAMPSFEDVGDLEAKRLGIKHDDEGVLVYQQ